MMDAGHIKIYALENTAEAGSMPSMAPVFLAESDFESLSIGITRQYSAKGVGEQVDALVRIWAEGVPIRIGSIAVITDSDFQEDAEGDQYRISNVQPTRNANNLKVIDLTLERLEEAYEL